MQKSGMVRIVSAHKETTMLPKSLKKIALTNNVGKKHTTLLGELNGINVINRKEIRMRHELLPQY